MDIQVFGLIMASVCMICGTALAATAIVNKQNNAHRAEQCEKDRVQSARNNTFNCESLALYNDEKERREAAETRELIVRHQLNKERKEVERLKKLVSVLEGRC